MKDYSKAFVEVIEILKHIPKDEYEKIPKEKIEFFISNMDKEYEFNINPEIELSQQNISREANAIIVTIFRDYFLTEIKKEKLNRILQRNQDELEKEKRKRYNPDKIFDKKESAKPEVEEKINTALQEIKEESIFQKIINYIKRKIRINR